MLQKFKDSIPAILLLISFTLFILGLVCPILMAKSSVFGVTLSAKSVYLTDTIKYFSDEGEWLMALVILITTLVFPLIKYIDVANRVFSFFTISDKTHTVLGHLDKWSMTEVFVVALVILSVKMNSKFMSMEIRSGVTFLTLSIILRMITVYVLSHDKLKTNKKLDGQT